MTPKAVSPFVDRRREVEAALIESKLLRGPRRVAGRRRGGQPKAVLLHQEAMIPTLAEVLPTLGPIFTAFGHYLGSRGDLFPAQECLRLASTQPESPVAMAWSQVSALFIAHLGLTPEEIFLQIEQEPCDSNLLYQSHRGQLRTGQWVEVRCLRPSVEHELEQEMECLSLLERVLAEAKLGSEPFPWDEVAMDFRRHLSARMDFDSLAETLQFLGRDVQQHDLLTVPKVFVEFSGSKILTLEWLQGVRVEDLATRPNLLQADAFDLARRLGLLWLQMALTGRYFPIEADVKELMDGRLAIVGGVFSSLPAACQANLWSYLRFTAAHFPDRATPCLLREMSKQRRAAPEGELRTRLRQVIPFRDGSISISGESLAEYALLHWLLARGYGYLAQPHLAAFYRGLFWVTRLGHLLRPDSDPLGEALEDLQWVAGWNQFRQRTSPRQVGATAESYMENFLELPQKIDRLLNMATDPAVSDGFRIPVAETNAQRQRRNKTVVVICVCLLMGALGLLSQHLVGLFVTMGLSMVWGERLITIVFLALGAVLLRAAWSTR